MGLTGKFGVKGRRYTIGGQSLQPKEFVGRDGFKLMNYVIEWAKTKQQAPLSKAKRIIEERYLNLGITHIRAPHEYTFWRGKVGQDFWNTPANHHDVVDLKQRPGGTFRLSQLERAVIQKQCALGTGMGIWFDKPYLWTIKHYEGKMGDPRTSQIEANIWNGHYLGSMGRFIAKMRDKFGYVPFINEIANEYNTVNPELTRDQIKNMCQRWHVRDAGELIGIDQAGPPIDPDGKEVPYVPELGNGAWSPDDIRLHPHRSFHGNIEWWDIGEYVDEYFGHYRQPVYIDEPILLMPTKAYDELPPGDWWRYGGTKRKSKYGEMLEDLWSRGFYVCIHDGGSDEGSRHGGGVSAGWTPFDDKPGEIDDFIRELLGGSIPPPPPPTPEWSTVYEDVTHRLQRRV